LRLDALKFAKARELVVIYLLCKIRLTQLPTRKKKQNSKLHPKFLKACELFQIFEATNLVCSQIQSFERNLDGLLKMANRIVGFWKGSYQMVETSNPLNPIMGQIQFLKLQQVFKAGNFG